MKIFNTLVFTCTLILITAFKSVELPAEFQQLLVRSEMDFIPPKDFIPVDALKNTHIKCMYALKHPEKQFEVQYIINPLDEQLRIYAENEKNKQPGDINIHPNTLYTTLLKSTTLNISGGYLPETVVFDSVAVNKEFNADWGGTTFVELAPDFAPNYKYAMIVGIHKNNVADAYLIFLSDKMENYNDIMLSAFHSLRFK